MGYNAKFNDIRYLMNVTIGQFSTWQEEINQILNNIQALVNLESFQGKTAQSAKSYLSEVHNLLLSAIISTMQDYRNKMFLYLDGYYQIDSHKYTVIDEEVLEDVKREYESNRSGLEHEASRLERSLSNISDIFSIPAPKPYTLMDHFDQVQNRLMNLNDDIINHEDKCMTDSTDLENLILALKKNINEYMTSGTSKVVTYQAGDFTTGEHIVDLATQMQISMDYSQKHEAEITKAIENEMRVIEEIQKEYEEACKQRKDKGVANMIMGGVTVIAGAAIIIGTAGMATPIVVTAVVTGTSTVAYGASNIMEGGFDYYYGAIGNLSSTAFNPIRDTVFSGNQTAYDMWGSFNMTIGSLMVPTGAAIKGAKTMGTSVSKAIIREVGKEIIIDKVVDFSAGAVTNFVSSHIDLSQTQTVLLNVGLSIAGEKGLEAGIDHSPLGNKGVSSFGELMDDAEAVRYNDYWNRVEIEKAGGFANLMDEADAKLYNQFIDDSIAGVDRTTNSMLEGNIRDAMDLNDMALAEIAAKKIVGEIDADLLKQPSNLFESEQVKVETVVNSTEGASKTVKSVDDVVFNQSSLDKAFTKHSGDFDNYADGSKASVDQFKNDVSQLIETGTQKAGTWKGVQGTHIYNLSTQQWAFINADGSFNTAFKLSSQQYEHLIKTGVVK